MLDFMKGLHDVPRAQKEVFLSAPETVKISLPDGKSMTFPTGVTGEEVAAAIGPGLGKAALAAEVDGRQWDLFRPIEGDARIRIITRKDPEALELIRHDAAHVLAMAVQDLFPGTQVTIGPAIENGFYYDFVREQPFTHDDLARIEARMHEIVEQDLPTRREVWPRTVSNRLKVAAKIDDSVRREQRQDRSVRHGKIGTRKV